MRLINADALIAWIDCGHLRPPTELCFSEYDVVKMLKDAPTIDAVPREMYDTVCDEFNKLNTSTKNINCSTNTSTDTISRAEAIEAVKETLSGNVYWDYVCDAVNTLSALPSAEAEPKVIRSKTLMPTKDFKEWAKRIRETNPNAVVIPCDAEVVSAEAVQTDCTDFVLWLLEEVMDDENWEMNAVGMGEIICRKLKKLGLLEVKDGYYIRPSADTVPRDYYEKVVGQLSHEVTELKGQTEQIVRCKDCRWYDNRYGEVCHNPRYGDGHANYQPPYVDEDYWCKDGERKGGDADERREP